MSDEFANADAAYVLGALGAAERQTYEKHLDACATCARSVRELAGIPGLLSRLDETEFELTAQTPPLPATLLPTLSREVRRRRRVRRSVLGGVAAAAVLATTALGIETLDRLDADRPPAASTEVSPPVEMRQLGQQTLEARLAMDSVRWGTRLRLTCDYPAEDAGDPTDAPAYALVIHTRDGRNHQVATWRPVPGRSIDLVAATAVVADEIASVDVRPLGGRPVLELAS